MQEKATNGVKPISKNILEISIKLILNPKRKINKKVINILLLSLSFFTISCSNIRFKGELKGNNRGAVNEIIILADLTENVRMKSKISKPYSIEQKMDFGIPEYAETSLEIKF